MLLAIFGCSSNPIPQVGDKAPAFTLESIDGKKISMSDYKNKIVLIVFTSVDCENCEKQLPYIKAVYEQSNGRLVILNIYQFNTANRVKEYVANKQLQDFLAMPDPKGEIATAYGVARTPPGNFIIDSNGIIVLKKLGPFQSQEEIEDILKSL